MSAVDLKKNRKALLDAHSAVLDPKNPIQWAVFGYEGQTNVLKMVEMGEDPEEICDELNSAKIMYAFLHVTDRNTGLDKFVLVNWQGEATPGTKKGLFVTHITDIAALFRGHHLLWTARNDDDMDEDLIYDKVAKSSGCNYSFHKEVAKPIPEAKPVASVYKRTVPQREIKPNRRDQFWQRQESEDQDRRASDQQRQTEQTKKLDNERRQREEEEARLRDSKESDRMKKVWEVKQAEKRANQPDRGAEKQRWENSQVEAMQDEDERRKRSDMIRKERQRETDSLVKQRANNESTMFESQSSMGEERNAGPPRRKIIHDFVPRNNEAPAPRKAPITIPRGEPEVYENTPQTPPPDSPPESPRQPAPQQPMPVSRAPRVPEPEPVRAPSPPPVRIPAQTQPSVDDSAPPRVRNLLTEGLPQRTPDSEEEEDDDAWGDEEDTPPQHQAPVAPPARQREPEPQYDDEVYENQEYDRAQDVVTSSEAVRPISEGGDADQGTCARALYDYQAADDTEITFDPDDIITNIEKIDEGWWTGVGPDGNHGMFPSNYVEEM